MRDLYLPVSTSPVVSSLNGFVRKNYVLTVIHSDKKTTPKGVQNSTNKFAYFFKGKNLRQHRTLNNT